MPTHPLAGAIIVVSVAVAAAIAVYESPQARQFAEDVRRRIAIALHALGDEINPANQSGEPRFNRPEDAEGFLLSQGAISGSSAEPGVVADDESARRQREELMYWNAIHLEKLARQKKALEQQQKSTTTGPSFENFLQEDKDAERGTTYVYNTGADARHSDDEQGLRNRGSAASGVRGLNRSAAWANPFGDEHNIEFEEQRALDASLISPDPSERYEVLSEGLYSANEDPAPRRPQQTMAEMLVDTSDPPNVLPEEVDEARWTLEHSAPPSQQRQNEAIESAFASIHAWADDANRSFYSPLPTTPRALSPQLQTLHIAIPGSPTFSDPPLSVPGGSGDVTPTTDSMSLAGSGDEVWAPRSGATSEADVMSVDGDGIVTPGSWTEVGSVVSDNDVVIH